MASREEHDRNPICPECEMPLKTGKRSECPYCGTILIDTVLEMDEEEQSDLVEDLHHQHPRRTD
jgi:uncharacterized Zn finger protein (UPF0148 family)